MVRVPLDTPKEFGQALARLRNERGVSLDEIVQRTKIGRRVLEGLEEGDLARLPERVFARMFLRQILALLREPPEVWLEAFDRAYDRFEHSSQSFPVVHLPPTRPARVWPWLLALALVAAGVTGLLLLGRSPAPAPAGDVPPTPEMVVREALAAATPPAANEPVVPTPTPPPATLLVLATSSRPCWVEVLIEGVGRFQRLLPAGTSWEIDAGGKAVDLLLGDGGAVEVSYLGRHNASPGRPGEVVRLRLEGAAGGS